jgi:hypothetical protein
MGVALIVPVGRDYKNETAEIIGVLKNLLGPDGRQFDLESTTA